MNWSKIFICGLVAGIVGWIANFVMHGLIMGPTYMKYPSLFTQEQANPMWFLLVGFCVSLASAILFAKTRRCWADGLAGGLTFGFFSGLVLFFLPFYYSLVLEGFPYHLSWCWGGIDMIGFLIQGAIFGLIYKR